eukprot:TRINITY_DN27208_c0_g1_i1.p2 TRINITY_DN27208_c0_g1~~TRINITY_DN27208_c0_g1_i1.p2  ORF type:complete len:116 (-),score=38.21 TRINITY_DN27208_c0_g1_i1:55-402(-)
MLRSLVGSEMCIRDRYQRRVRGVEMVSQGQVVSLVAAGLAGIPVGSIYAWSVYVDPINAARDDWTHAGEHATSVVIAALAISCAVSGRVVGGAVSIQLLCPVSYTHLTLPTKRIV